MKNKKIDMFVHWRSCTQICGTSFYGASCLTFLITILIICVIAGEIHRLVSTITATIPLAFIKIMSSSDDMIIIDIANARRSDNMEKRYRSRDM